MADMGQQQRKRLEGRIAGLKEDFEAGQARLAKLDEETAQLRETLLRISGAIQVLEDQAKSDTGNL